MIEEQSWVIQTDDLQIGTTLSFDLTDTTGQVLHKAGMPIHERLKERLQKKNVHSVTIRGAAKFDNDQTDALLIDSFEHGSVQAIQTAMETTQKALRHLVAAVQKDGEGSVDELRENVNLFVEQANTDAAAALAAIALYSQEANSDILESVAKRSTMLSLLGVITSIIKADEPHESIEIGLAGLMHDCSLLLHPEWFSKNVKERGDRVFEEYQWHPIESAELLSRTDGIPKNAITLITQVHEQADGTGYPRGMNLAHTLPGASILNIADAYLALVEPIRGERLAPSDALAYLCYHAAKGKFCKDTLLRMIQGMSIYPVGSTVLLDDDSKALVIEGTPGKPMEPVVRLLALGNLRIDLRESNRTVLGPFVGFDSAKPKRIKKSQMQEILWRTDR